MKDYRERKRNPKKITSEDLRKRLILDSSEKVLRRNFQELDWPFLGLFGSKLTKDMREAAYRAISEDCSVRGYLHHLKRYPALFSVYLCQILLQTFGKEDYFQFWPDVMKALRLSQPPTSAEREQLCDGFRGACLTLGVDSIVSAQSGHRLVDTFLRQIGLSEAYAEDFAKRAIAFAKRNGIPDDDDPQAVVSWQEALELSLEKPFSQIARRAVQQDTQGYYTRLFLKLYSEGGEPQLGATKLEREMSKGFKIIEEETLVLKRATFPRVVLVDSVLGVFFPCGVEQEWIIDVDGHVRRFYTGAEDRFVPIPESLPLQISIRSGAIGQTLKTHLWMDAETNRLLFFSETGRLIARGQLDRNAVLNLPPGTYTVLSRFTPSEMDAEEISDTPRVVAFSLELGPGDIGSIRNGPARLDVHAESTPQIRWCGDSHTSKEGLEFQYGAANLDVELPQNWLSEDAKYDLTLMPGARGSMRRVSLEFNEQCKAPVSVHSLASQAGWKPGLMRLIIELKRSGEARILLRTAKMFWFGLSEISRGLRFRCQEWPENLQLEIGENVEREGSDLVVKDGAARSVRLVFSLTEAHQQSLTWNVPGVFVEVETFADGGVISRSRRILGSTEAVSLTSAKQVIVMASDPGTLRLGDWSQRVDFSRRSTRLVPASFLASRLTAQSNAFEYYNEVTGNTLTLLRLTQPHEVRNYSVKVQNTQLEIQFHATEPLDAVSVRVIALLSGDEDHFTLQANPAEWSSTRFGQARLMVLKANGSGYAAHVYLNLDYWPVGAWLFNLDAQVMGMWGHLQNSRQDVFAAGLLWGNGNSSLSSKAWLKLLADLNDRDSCDSLKRIHAVVQVCYANEAWDGIAWLGDAWKALVARWRGREADALTALVDMTAMRPPEDSSPSWVPQLSIAAALPGLFTLAADTYRQVNAKPDPISCALKAMSDMVIRWPTVFPDLLHYSASAGCTNFSAIERRGASPYKVDPLRYVNAMHAVAEIEYRYQLGDDDARPGPGNYLGPFHYRHAWRALERAYERTLQGNNLWRGQSIGLAKHACKVMTILDMPGVPSAWQKRSPHIGAWQAEADVIFDDDALQQRENLNQIAHLIAGLALACRREVRAPGALKIYMNRLMQAGIPVDGPLAFLMQIGDALFAYYLLLWEFVLKADEE